MMRLITAILTVCIYVSMILAVSGQVAVVYVAQCPRILQTGLIANWRLNEGSGQISYNQAGSRINPSPTNLFGNGGEQFALSISLGEGWAKTTNTTLTDFFAMDPNGNTGATRFVTTSGTDEAIDFPITLAAGTYTISFYVKSNTGLSQAVRLGVFGTSTSTDKTVTTSWTQISYTFTLGGSTSTFAGLENDTAQDVTDILIYGARLESGSSATAYKVPTFDQQLGSLSVADANDPSWTAEGLTMGSGLYGYGVSTVGAPSLLNMTVYAVVKKTGSDLGSGLEPIITSASNGQFYLHSLDTFNELDNVTGPEFGMGFPSLSVIHTHGVQLADGNYHLLTGTYDGTTLRLYLDGTEVSSATASLSALDVHRIYLSALQKSNSSTIYFPGKIAFGALYSVGHSASQVRQDFDLIRANLAIKSVVITPPAKFISIDGDSLSDAGAPTGITATQGWVYLMLHDINPIVQARNSAVNGSTLAGVAGRAAQIDATYNPNTAKNIHVVWVGGNDVVLGATPSTFVASLKSYCQARQAAGFKVVVATLTPQNFNGINPGSNAIRDSINSLIRADPSFYDALADLAADPTIGPDGAETNSTYYQADHLHLTAAGQALVKPIMKAAVISLF